MTDFAYPAEKFLLARRTLMVPNPRGEAESIAFAFHECSLGLHDIDRRELNDEVSALVGTLQTLMNTDGLADDTGRGLWYEKAETLSESDCLKLSRVVDDLALWFDRQRHGEDGN